MKIWRLFALLAAGGVVASGATLDSAPYRLDVAVTRLDNGLTLLVNRDAGVSDAACELWFRVGSSDEQPDQRISCQVFARQRCEGGGDEGPETSTG